MTSRVPRLLPLLAVAVGGVLALKVVSGLDGAPAFLKQAAAFAEEAPKPAKGKKARGPASGKADATPDAKGDILGDSAAPGAAAAAGATTPAPAMCAASAEQLAKDAGLSPAELRVLQGLQARRGELDEREQSMQTNLALLGAAETKVDGKLKALTDLKGEIQGMLGQVDAKQDAEVMRLVTVYSKMKPADAAAVMIQLDDKVRVPVAAKMKEAILAQVLGKMPPAEAKKLTEKLASRFQPSISALQQVAAAENGQAPAASAAASDKAAPAKAAPRPKARKAKPKAAAKQADAADAKATPAPAATKPAAAAAPAAGGKPS
ncbi:MAG: MotE family protein [Proteobacteria bacterium]|nr:MotE family protein [Pseudomonadota bacterium]